MDKQPSKDPRAAAFKTHVVRVGSAPQAAPAQENAAAPPTQPRPGDPKTWPKEVGGPQGPEPTRYGDWERNGICSDF